MVRALTVALLAAVLTTGCVNPPRFMQPIPVREFNTAIGNARAAAAAGQWAIADRILGTFIERHPRTKEAHEALYWRGLYRLAPTNDSTAHAFAIPTLEQYLLWPDAEHRVEAQIVLDLARSYVHLQRRAAEQERQIAEIREALGRVQERPATPSAEPAAPAERGLVQEVERLKAELARANQELERIRRRLAGQRP
jgi:hypothetical protein